MRTRFTLLHQNLGGIQFSNNDFDVSLAGWSQIAIGSSQAFSWNSPSSARASGSVANTHAIGGPRPGSSEGWHPGNYIIDITATNTSTGGSSPLSSGVSVYPSSNGSTLGSALSITGDSSWAVGGGTLTKRISFTLSDYAPYLFFGFSKQGTTSGYNVVFTIDKIEIISCPTVKEIAEPGGWDGAQLILERDETFHSLIERWEGGEDGGFVFYGNDGDEDGGIDFILGIEDDYSVDEPIEILAEIAMDDENFVDFYRAILDLSTIDETDDHEVKVAAVDSGPWPTFLNLINSEVDLSSNVDINGIAVDPVESVTVRLPPQPVRVQYEAGAELFGSEEVVDTSVLEEGQYLHLGFDKIELEELETVQYQPHILSNEEPDVWVQAQYGGIYNFEIQTVCYVYGNFALTPFTDMSDYVTFYLKIEGMVFGGNDNYTMEVPLNVIDTFTSDNIDGGVVLYLNLPNIELSPGARVRIYGRVIDDLNASEVPIPPGYIRWNGPVNNIPCGVGCFYNLESYARVTADTIYPETEAEGYFVHDLIFGVLARLGIPFHSPVLGSAVTKMKQYEEDGCFWRFVVLKGLQLRGYSLEEKPFFTSMKKIWDVIDPILCLGLGYELVDSVMTIVIDHRDNFYQSGTSVNFPNVSGLRRIYDKDRLFKQINVGYKKWESEHASGLDDPQTKRKYKTIFKRTGTEYNIESDGIAASLTFDTTRRMTREKSADYKFDNDIFVLAINENQSSPESPETWEPELDENFNSVAGLLNPDQRYNLTLTPMRNMLRHLKFILGCLQKNLDTEIMFSGGEGNYTMESDYNCATGLSCIGVICDNLAENSNIPLSVYAAGIGYMHLSKLIQVRIPMEFEEYESVRSQKRIAIGISQTESDFVEFAIKQCSFDFLNGSADFLVWPKAPFQISVIESDTEQLCE